MPQTPKLIHDKKPIYPIVDQLNEYLSRYGRITKIPLAYDDLLRFSGSVSVLNHAEEDTMWVRCYYNEWERKELDQHLTKLYNILHSDGSDYSLDFLNIDAIDYCTFGNTQPFRIKVRNILNDNFSYFYVKKADASRVYGLELEHLLSPNRINFLIYENTLIEEHIAGIPGDEFIKYYLPDCDTPAQSLLAREFVKFNERCTIRLLGDMRAYNYVVIPTHDFERVEYKIRAIDFDQQSYEGDLKVYQPHFFADNYQLVKLVERRLDDKSIEQYRRQERSLIAKRLMNTQRRYNRLLRCMKKDHIAPSENVRQLRRS
ncbi:MAG: hypothetical protein RQ756_03065, partial [Flavobacteriaceae bacterium]|nr:hypothetical protein [Flavobacteriaceae bacterium]